MGIRRPRGPRNLERRPTVEEEMSMDTSGLYSFGSSELKLKRYSNGEWESYHSYAAGGGYGTNHGSVGCSTTTDQTLADLRKCLEDAELRRQRLDRIKKEIRDVIQRVEEYRKQKPEQPS